MQELMRLSSLRSTIDIYTQAVTPAKHAAQAAVLSLFFAPNRVARFNPRSKKKNSDKTTVQALQGDGFEGAKGAPIPVPFAPTNARRTLRILLISYWCPRRDLNPCYRREIRKTELTH